MATEALIASIGFILIILECTAAPTTYTTEQRLSQDTVRQFVPENARLDSYNEFTEVRAPNMSEQALLERAKAAGMDEVAIAELLRTKNPVITTTHDASGHVHTTTYKLTPNGGISRQIVQEGNTASETPNTSFITKNSISSSLNSASAPTNNFQFDNFDETSKPVGSALSSDKKETDWEWASVPRTKTISHTFSNSRPFDFDHSFNTNWFNTDDYFERKPTATDRVNTDSWFFGKKFEIPTLPNIDGVTPRVTTKTEVDDQGRTRTITTTTYDSGPIITRVPETGYKPFPSIFDEPKPFASKPTLTLNIDDVFKLGTTTTPLPPLEDFLNKQYGTTTPKTIATINIDDFPVSTKASTNKKSDATWLHDLPHFDTSPSVPEKETKTKISTYSTTITGNIQPNINDLDANMRGVLIRAGITPEEIENSHGVPITRTRIGPEGQTITTTYRVQQRPATTTTFQAPAPLPSNPTSGNSATIIRSNGLGFNIEASLQPQLPRLTPSTQHSYSHRTEHSAFPTYVGQSAISTTTLSPIDDFLAKVDLKPADIENRKGEIVKTFIDDKGRVLSATFVLSSIKGDESEKQQQEEPLK